MASDSGHQEVIIKGILSELSLSHPRLIEVRQSNSESSVRT